MLGESLDYQRTLDRVAELSVTWLADACVLYVMEGDEPRRVAAATADPSKRAALDEVGRLSNPYGYEYVREVARSASPRFSPRVGQTDLVRYVPDPEARRIVRELGVRSGIALPLPAGGRVVGVLTLLRTTNEAPFHDRDLAVATELARRAAAAIDNARLYREKEEAVRARDEFLSIASHELRTPIASLRMMTDVIADGSLALGGPDHARAISVIERQARRLQSLVDNLLDVSQIESGYLRVQVEPIDLVEVARQTLESWSGEIARARCEVKLSSPSPAVVGRWDRHRLEQVIANLLSNALKFGPGAPVTIDVEPGEGTARLVMIDRGIGIRAEALPHIFGRFERAVPSAHYGGMGLGLYIVKKIVDAMQGGVSVESTVDQGTRVTVTLPLEPPAAAGD